jgi:hypothetical protein
MSRVVESATFAGMDTTILPARAPSARWTSLTRVSQRRGLGSIYHVTAWLFFAVAVVGFGPSTMAIASGRRPAPLAVIHVHAALMVAWLLLFVAQTGLVATGRVRTHRTLGLVSFALAPAMYVMMIAAWIVTYRHAPESGRVHAANMVIVAINVASMFAVFYTWAMLARRTAPETHKRLIVMATLVLLSAAVGRMGWLPWNGGPADRFNYVCFAYVLALLAPALLHDVVRRGRVHRAYVAGVGLFASWILAASLLWDAPWWQRLAPVLFGVQ